MRQRGLQIDVMWVRAHDGNFGNHAADAVVTASIAAATTNLYARAGINLHEALQKAAAGGMA